MERKQEIIATGSQTSKKAGVSEKEYAYMYENKMVYEQDRYFGVTNSAYHMKQYADQRTYDGGREIYTSFNTGEAFLDPQRSWINMKINPRASDNKAVADATFGSGSALNIFSEVLINSRGGSEISRTQEAHVYNHYRAVAEHDNNWFSNVGPLVGFPTYDSKGSPDTAAVISSAVSVKIPLCMISEFFNTNKLIPPAISSGLRIRLYTNPIGIAFAAGTALANYQILEFEWHLRVVNVMDGYRRKVSEIAASEGLFFNYNETYQDRTASDQTQFNLRVDRATEMATHFTIVPRLTANLSDATTDSLSTSGFDYSQFSYKVGVIQMPQSPLLTSSAADISDFYAHTIDALGFMRDTYMSPSIPYSTGSFGYGNTTDTASKAIICSSLMSQDQTFSGLLLNATRSLNIDLRFISSAVRSVDLFLTFRRTLIATLTNVIVED